MPDDFILRPLDIEQDAEELARMWNESDDQWPGTLTGGVPMTAESMRRWHEREAAIDVLVWESPEGRIVGYCSFQKDPEEEGVGYVSMLNVHPAYQKRSLGRRFLTTYVERCIELGFRRLDLHTWPGNLKAVPLYKKTGFFWMPDTQVWMLNFIPAILTQPWARPYFDHHDWYRTFQRTLDQKEDDERWEGMKVFTYRWAEDDNSLTVWVDREARAITAVETDTFFAAAIPATISPPQGLPLTMRWRLRNKGDAPLTISLIARGTEHLRLDHQATLELAPGEETELSATVDVAAEMPRVKKDKPAPQVQTLLVVNGQLVELGTGLRPQPAVVVTVAPSRAILCPGVEQTIRLQLRNALDKPVQATLSLVAPPGLHVSIEGSTQQIPEGQRIQGEHEGCSLPPSGGDVREGETEIPVHLPPYGHAGFPLTVRAESSGVYPLQAEVSFQVDGQQGRAAPQRLPLFALLPGQVLADADQERVRVENEHASFEVMAEGGRLIVHDRQTERQLLFQDETLGPPFHPPEFYHRPAALEVRHEAGRVVVTARLDSERYPGLTFHKELTFSGGTLVQMAWRVVNRGRQAVSPQLYQSFRPGNHDEAIITVPLRPGLVRAPLADYPRTEEDLPRDVAAYAEHWLALEGRRATIGVIWDQQVNEVNYDWHLALCTAPQTCPPRAWTDLARAWIYVGPGDWAAVRRACCHLTGAGTGLPAPSPRPLYDLRLEPSPPVTLDEALTATLTLDNLRARPLEGTLRLTPPPGWAVEPQTFTFAGVSLNAPFIAPITMHQTDRQSGVFMMQAYLSTPLFDQAITLPVVRLGDRSEVNVSEEEHDGQMVYRLHNGHTCFLIAPAYSGAVVGWLTPDGVNHLYTPFPQVGALGWMSPWHGGLTPYAALPQIRYEFPGKLYQEHFTAAPVEVTDGRGIPWRGVRLTAELKREELRGLRLELDYLTVGNSPLLKAVYRVVNPTGAQRVVNGGWIAFWAVDGDPAKGVLRAEGWERKRVEWGGNAWPWVGDWAAVTNADTKRTAITVSTDGTAYLSDWGRDGGHTCVGDRLFIPAEGTAERVVYFALAADFPSATRYACLKDYR